jgi:hypothetical protein
VPGSVAVSRLSLPQAAEDFHALIVTIHGFAAIIDSCDRSTVETQNDKCGFQITGLAV